MQDRRTNVAVILAAMIGLGLPLATPSASATPAKASTSSADYACGQPIGVANQDYGTCTFSEDFTGHSLNRNKWAVQLTSASNFGSPVACFVDSPNNVSVSGGNLKLTARKEPQPFTCQSPKGDYQTQSTSGMVSTWRRFSQTYGVFKIRAKFPNADVRGLQSALWMWPQERKYGYWPTSGEIDIAEVYSVHSDRAIPYLHYVSATADPTVTNNYCMIENLDEFHTFMLEWTETNIKISYDGETCIDHVIDAAAPLTGSAPFDHPFFIALTQGLGVGGNSFDPNSTPLPATTTIDYVYAWDGVEPPLPPAVDRFGGADRYATAVEISNNTFKPGVDAVFIATGKGFADGLAGGPAAAKADAPLLLVPGSHAPPAVLAEVQRLNPKRIYILGGQGVVKSTVASQLELATGASVTRLAGPNRYATAARTAFMWDSADTVYLASGQMFPDALSGGATAAAYDVPLLLTKSNTLPPETRDALRRLTPKDVIVVGGTSVVSLAVFRAVQNVLPRANIIRVGGSDRYETSAKLVATQPDTATKMMLASGKMYADSLAGVPASAEMNAAFALSKNGCPPSAMDDESLLGQIVSFVLLGGKAVLDGLLGTSACGG